MSLKARLIWSVLEVLTWFGLIEIGIQRGILFPSYELLERNNAITNIRRAEEAIKGEIHHLDSFCHHGSAWDKTCHNSEIAKITKKLSGTLPFLIQR